MRTRVFVVGLGAFVAGLCLAGSTPDGDQHPSKDMVLVEIGATRITYADLQKKEAALLFAADTAYYDAERQAIDALIDDLLLQQQAAKEGVTVDQLIEKHVKSSLPPDPSEEALHVYYEGVETAEPFDAVRDKILAGLRDHRMKKAKAAYLLSLRQQTPITLRLPPPRTSISLSGVPVRGTQNAPVVLTEYADYECPYCQQIQPAIAKLEKEFPGKLAIAYKDFPLPIHANAQKAAEASHCAAAQGKYWEFHDLMLEKKRTDLVAVKQFARDLKLDGEAFDKCLDSGAQAAEVKKSVDEGNSIGLSGTPMFFVNGRFVNGASFEKLRDAISEELSAVENQRASERAQREK